MKKTIGIIGGMGPMATCDIFKKIIEITDASCDSDHAKICIDCNTDIPDRTKAILNNGPDPVPEMKKSAAALENMGADVLIMPCNTAHYFYDQITPCVNIPVLNMLDETANELSAAGIKKAGLLATSGTVESGVYKKALDKFAIEVVTPSDEGQNLVMSLIYDGVKAGNYLIDTAPFKSVCEKLFDDGAEVLILGCTELPIAFEKFNLNYKSIDPTLVLAKKAAEFAGVPLKPVSVIK